MSKGVATRGEGPGLPISNEQADILRKTLFKGFNDEEMAFCLAVCSRTGLDPFLRQIHFTKRKNRKSNDETIVITTGIDGFRLSANRSRAYAGSDDPQFEIEKDANRPRKATVTVYTIVGGQRCPFTASVRWDEFYPGDDLGFMWRKMPFQMLGKCAEAQALRKAFPVELSGLYLGEEMQQADNDKQLVETRTQAVNATLLTGAEPAAPEFEAADYFEPVDAPAPTPGDYVLKAGQGKGKKLRDVPKASLDRFITWFDEQTNAGKRPHPEIAKDYEAMHAYLAEGDPA